MISPLFSASSGSHRTIHRNLGAGIRFFFLLLNLIFGLPFLLFFSFIGVLIFTFVKIKL